jgi:hypothetical protein
MAYPDGRIGNGLLAIACVGGLGLHVYIHTHGEPWHPLCIPAFCVVVWVMRGAAVRWLAMKPSGSLSKHERMFIMSDCPICKIALRSDRLCPSCGWDPVKGECIGGDNLPPLSNGGNAANLRALIADAHMRMATNRDVRYRVQQQKKIHDWLEELTRIYESDPGVFLI